LEKDNVPGLILDLEKISEDRVDEKITREAKKYYDRSKMKYYIYIEEKLINEKGKGLSSRQEEALSHLSGAKGPKNSKFHDNIIYCIEDSYEEKGVKKSFYEYSPCNLIQLLSLRYKKGMNTTKYTLEEFCFLAENLIAAFSYSTQHLIAHGNIKFEAIYLDLKRKNYFVGDWEEHIKVKSGKSDEEYELHGNKQFMAPELRKEFITYNLDETWTREKMKYDPLKADAFSLAKLLYDLLDTIVLCKIEKKEQIENDFLFNYLDKRPEMREDLGNALEK